MISLNKSDKNKLYYQNNKERLAEKQKIRRQAKKDETTEDAKNVLTKTEKNRIYYQNNKETLAEKQKIRRQAKKDERNINEEKNVLTKSEYNKTYYENNKEILAEKQKIRRDANREKLRKQSREYYHLNKEKILNQQNTAEAKEAKKAYQSFEIKCECGHIVQRHSMSKHLESKYHLKHSEKKENETILYCYNPETQYVNDNDGNVVWSDEYKAKSVKCSCGAVVRGEGLERHLNTQKQK